MPTTRRRSKATGELRRPRRLQAAAATAGREAARRITPIIGHAANKPIVDSTFRQPSV